MTSATVHDILRRGLAHPETLTPHEDCVWQAYLLGIAEAAQVLEERQCGCAGCTERDQELHVAKSLVLAGKPPWPARREIPPALELEWSTEDFKTIARSR